MDKEVRSYVTFCVEAKKLGLFEKFEKELELKGAEAKLRWHRNEIYRLEEKLKRSEVKCD